MMERDSFDAERLRQESEERQRRLAAEAPPVYLSGVRKPESSTHFEVDIGFRGDWTKKSISQDISEEEFNRLASELFNEGVATPDFINQPHRDQQLRCFRDLSEGDDNPLWITLHCRELSRTLTMKVSANTSQEAIERTIFEELATLVIFAHKFPSVLESNGTYQLKRLVADSEPEPEPDQEEPVGLKVIHHKQIAHKPVMFTRSGSADDIKGVALSADVPPKSDLLATWIIKFGNEVTQVTAEEGSNVQEVCDRAAIELGIGIKKWTTTIDRKGSRIFVYCTSPEPIAQEASIHFGNQEWAGKVNRGYSDVELVREAQTQLGLEGTWQVRHSVTVSDVRTIEAERIEQEIERPALPRDSEVVFDFYGTQKAVALKAGATAWDQAQAAQKAFGTTVECSPIEETGDPYTIHVYKPSVYPVIFVRGDDRIRSWLDNTKLKIAQEEARRLFGGRPTLELLAEPGLVYQVKTSTPRSSKAKAKPESNTRQMTGPWIRPVGPPSIGHRRATPKPEISQRSADG
jgi:hypothetical protein